MEAADPRAPRRRHAAGAGAALLGRAPRPSRRRTRGGCSSATPGRGPSGRRSRCSTWTPGRSSGWGPAASRATSRPGSTAARPRSAGLMLLAGLVICTRRVAGARGTPRASGPLGLVAAGGERRPRRRCCRSAIGGMGLAAARRLARGRAPGRRGAGGPLASTAARAARRSRSGRRSGRGRLLGDVRSRPPPHSELALRRRRPERRLGPRRRGPRGRPGLPGVARPAISASRGWGAAAWLALREPASRAPRPGPSAGGAVGAASRPGPRRAGPLPSSSCSTTGSSSLPLRRRRLSGRSPPARGRPATSREPRPRLAALPPVVALARTLPAAARGDAPRPRGTPGPVVREYAEGLEWLRAHAAATG